MTEIGNLTVRIDAVITDEQYHEAMDAVRAANERMDLLEVENIKLRELVLQLWECPIDDSKCTDCPHCKEHYDVCAGENHCKLYDRMRELGVEVSE